MFEFRQIYTREGSNHLLTGNGFNLNFGYKSDYRNIFLEMQASDSQSYDDDFKCEVIECGDDLEAVLERHKDVLAKKAIKTDFIKALMKIVRDAEENKERAARFISQFNSVFTLNYDPFLYKIGLHLARISRRMSGQYSDHIIRLDEKLRDINFPNNKLFNDFSKTEKSTLYAACSDMEGEKTAFKKEAMTFLAREEEPDRSIWKMSDGFSKQGDEYVWNENDSNQNLFYLHGALHIYQDGEWIKKISVGRLDTLKTRIIERIDEGDSIDVIFKSSDKIRDIERNKYMRGALRKLKNISGNLFLYGVSLSENDHHIWDAIRENQNIRHIYVSVFDESKWEYEAAKKRLGQNRIDYFHSQSINT